MGSPKRTMFSIFSVHDEDIVSIFFSSYSQTTPLILNLDPDVDMVLVDMILRVVN